MSRRNVIFWVLFILLIVLAGAFYFFIKSQDITKTPEETRQEEVLNELNDFKRDSTDVKTSEEVLDELDSFIPTFPTIFDTPSSENGGSGDTASTPSKPKTQAEIQDELNAFQAPPKDSSDETLDSLNEFNP